MTPAEFEFKFEIAKGLYKARTGMDADSVFLNTRFMQQLDNAGLLIIDTYKYYKGFKVSWASNVPENALELSIETIHQIMDFTGD